MKTEIVLFCVSFAIICSSVSASNGLGTDKGEGKQKEVRSKLSALPYLSGYKPVPEKTGVIHYDPKKAFNGLNLYIPRDSPHVVLMDMQGDIIHEWKIDLEKYYTGTEDEDIARNFLERARLFENGEVLAIYVSIGIVKINKNSDLIWLYKNKICHHDFDLDEKGNIYVLTSQEIPGHAKLKFNNPIIVDFITVLDSQGRETRNISILDCFLNSDYSSVLLNINRQLGQKDIFHTNTLEIIKKDAGENLPMFKKGYAVISLCYLNTIAVINLEQEKVVWALSGLWEAQHHPTLLDNSNILLFDNLGCNGLSKVIEFNPLTQEIVWAYRGDDRNKFCSHLCGRNQRLPNGNTLITDTENGRLFEVTPENEIVWEFITPLSAQGDDRITAAISEGMRINPEEVPFILCRDKE